MEYRPSGGLAVCCSSERRASDQLAVPEKSVLQQIYCEAQDKEQGRSTEEGDSACAMWRPSVSLAFYLAAVEHDLLDAQRVNVKAKQHPGDASNEVDRKVDTLIVLETSITEERGSDCETHRLLEGGEPR